MTPKRIYILMGNPDKEETLSNEFADTYEHAAKEAGHEVRRANLSDLSFDPILHKGYKVIQELEPDLKKVQEDMKWADHFVLVYPLWWAGMPALLKGLFDRMWIPGFAFHFWKNGLGWDKLMKGKTARVVILSKNWPIVERFLFGDFKNEVGKALLGFSGYKVRITEVGHSEGLSDSQRESWKRSISKLAKKGV
jgi:NAD(P)H dehydrogenase (quinone)